MDLSGFQKALINQYEGCQAYRKICTNAHFSPYEPIEDVSKVPFVLSSLFKRSLGLFPELTCVSKERIHTWTFSSSTSGDPSIVGRTLRDIRVRNQGYVRMRRRIVQGVDMSLLFLPSPKFLRRDHLTLFDRPLEPFLASLLSSKTSYLSDKENTFLLLRPNNNGMAVNKALVSRKLEEAQEAKKSVILGGSVIFTYLFLTWLKEKGVKFQLGDMGYVSTGAGGWDGRKGNVNLEEEIDKQRYVELTQEVLDIPIENILDGYGTAEFPLMCSGRYSQEFKDFLYHNPEMHVIIRRKGDLSPVNSGERGFIELLTSETEGYPGAAILTDDTALLVSDEEYPVFTNIRRSSTSDKTGCAAFI